MGLIMLCSIRGAHVLSSWFWVAELGKKGGLDLTCSRLEVAAVPGGSACVLTGQRALSINKNNSEIN